MAAREVERKTNASANATVKKVLKPDFSFGAVPASVASDPARPKDPRDRPDSPRRPRHSRGRNRARPGRPTRPRTPRLPRGASLGSCPDTSGALQGRFWGRACLNSRSRKRRKSRPCSASYMPESPTSTADAIWRKCVAFAKTRFAGAGPKSSSRRRSRGAKGRFGPFVDGPCPLQNAAEDGADTRAAGASGANRARGRACKRRANSFRDQDAVL